MTTPIKDPRQELLDLYEKVERLENFIKEWLSFEEGQIKKHGPYFELPIPELMSKAKQALESGAKLKGNG